MGDVHAISKAQRACLSFQIEVMNEIPFKSHAWRAPAIAITPAWDHTLWHVISDSCLDAREIACVSRGARNLKNPPLFVVDVV
jgi:hypothetical protein